MIEYTLAVPMVRLLHKLTNEPRTNWDLALKFLAARLEFKEINNRKTNSDIKNYCKVLFEVGVSLLTKRVTNRQFTVTFIKKMVAESPTGCLIVYTRERGADPKTFYLEKDSKDDLFDAVLFIQKRGTKEVDLIFPLGYKK